MAARSASIPAKLNSGRITIWPKRNINPERWGLFLVDVEGTEASVYIIRHGAYIPPVVDLFVMIPVPSLLAEEMAASRSP